MRASSTVVVLSSLLIAASAAAGSGDKAGGTPSAPAKTTPAKTGSGSAAATGSAGAPAPSPDPVPPTDPASVNPADMPTAVRMRRLEQQTQALKERAWQLKARVQMLKEQMLGGGVGAQTLISHANDMGSSFRLTKLIYSLDGTQVFVRTDDTGDNLYKTKSFDIFSGPISPGNHTLAVVATYRGHGYGVFEYLSKYTFTAKGGQTFTAGEGKVAKVDCKGFEKGGPTTPLEKRASVECKVTQVAQERPADKAPVATPPTPASTPAPATTPGK
ncbi:MAG: hypothetical protein H6Q90_3167 [Deltaproteobacteria bacterium]|nr:hypothetical protein [Deltaproteobacteria bacterium]